MLHSLPRLPDSKKRMGMHQDPHITSQSPLTQLTLFTLMLGTLGFELLFEAISPSRLQE